MQISKETIEKYKEVHKRKTGKDISNGEAYEQASNLIQVLEAIYKPVLKSEAKKLNRGIK